jgi:amphi-Trp domain-containing protein
MTRGWSVALIEHSTKERLSREAAADRLRELADQLSRHNEVSFSRDGLPYRVDVPDEVELTVEVEIGDDKSEIEVEIEW